MARENQGLQIALIIFVMLTIVLAVTTFLFYRKSDDALKAAKDADTKWAEKNTALELAQAECGDLKRLMGFAATMSLDDVKTQFKKDMDTYVPEKAYPDDARFYSLALPKLADVIKAKISDLESRDKDLQKLKDTIAARESGRVAQDDRFKTTMTKAGQDVAALAAAADAERKRITQDQESLARQLDKVRKESKVTVDKAEARIQEAGVRMQMLSKLNEEKSTKIEKISRETMDIPNGEIRWVNQHNGTVWINLGQADGLERQVTFSVYSGDATDLGKAVKKASIEVTKILGDHIAEARVMDDKIANPIMMGDKIYTPLWTTGERTHFALAGFMDLDGDGRNQIATVRNLITMNGGVVDAEMDEKGKRTGEMNIHTRYLVMGDEPGTKGQQEAISSYSNMVREADRLGIRKLSLSDLKQKMGYKKDATVQRFGTASSAGDSRSKPAGGSDRAKPADGTRTKPAASTKAPAKAGGAAKKPAAAAPAKDEADPFK
jgi:hypothetical protein